nr:hypothetical protein [Tanacetum cinerariifolium]
MVPFHTRKIFTTLRVNSHSFSGRTVLLFPSMLVTIGEGSGTTTESHYTPSPEAQQTSPTSHSSSSLPPVTTELLPTIISSDTPPLKQYTRRTMIAQSSVLPPVADEPAYPLRDDSQGEACPTASSFEADQDRENIAKTSTLSSDSTPRVTSLAADEGRLSCWRTEKEEVLHNLEKMSQSRGGVWMKGRKQLLRGWSILTASPPGTGVPTGGVSIGSDVVPTSSPIFTIATVATPYTRRKGKEKMVESEIPKKKKIQEQIDVQMARQQAANDKEKELWVELKRLYEPDVEDLLWTHTQNMMHDPVEWRLYDSCGVHHVLSKDQEIFILVEKEYPLRKGLAIAMIINKLQVENYSQMANDLILKIHKIANSLRQQDD